MNVAAHNAYKAALGWYIDQGADEALVDHPVNRFAISPVIAPVHEMPSIMAVENQRDNNKKHSVSVFPQEPSSFLGTSEAYGEAVRLARGANTLDELRAAISSFDGIALKKTASNLVFSDGNPNAHVMVVGEAPGTDEDRLGKPFVGLSGQLLDKILKCIKLDRQSEDPAASVYISNILNWRPPGNRTPSSAEIEVSLPFIERHIQLVQPKLLILCGGVAAQSLLGRSEGVTRLRNKFHDYKTLTENLQRDCPVIPAIVTYHPSFLLGAPAQKKAIWGDMLEIAQKMALFT